MFIQPVVNTFAVVLVGELEKLIHPNFIFFFHFTVVFDALDYSVNQFIFGVFDFTKSHGFITEVSLRIMEFVKVV